MAEAELKDQVVAGRDLEAPSPTSVKLAEGQEVSQNFFGSKVHVGDKINVKIVHIHHIGNTSPNENPQDPQESTDEDISKNIAGEEGWNEIAPSIHINFSKPLKKGARVFPGRQKLGKSWRNVAIKIIDHNEKNWDEVTHLHKLEHPNVVTMHDAGKFKADTQQYIYIVMQLCPQTLDEFIQENKHQPFPFKRYFLYAKQIIEGVRFIHENGYMHRNIDPENILVYPSKNRCVISDFGLSKQLQERQSTDLVSSQKTFTEGFKAPEIHADPKVYSFRSDAFSIGIVISMLFSGGNHPYGKNDSERQENIVNNVSPDLSSISKSMEQWPEKREQLLDLIRNLLDPEPQGRLEPKQMLEHQFFEDSSLHHRPSFGHDPVDNDSLRKEHNPASLPSTNTASRHTKTVTMKLRPTCDSSGSCAA